MKFISKKWLDSIYILFLCCIFIYISKTDSHELNSESDFHIANYSSNKIIQISKPGELTLTYYLTSKNLPKIENLLKITQSEIITGTKYYISPHTERIYFTEPISGYNRIALGIKININKAGLNELTALPGISTGTAENITRYRNNHGDFENINGLLDVYGIGITKFTRIKDLISVN